MVCGVGWGGVRALLPEILGQLAPVGAKSPIFSRYSLVAAPIYPCENDWWGRPLLPEILGHNDHVGGKSPIFNLFSSVAPQT